MGKIPDVGARMQGSYQISESGIGPPGDGVIRINGSEVWRAPHGQRPYPETFFDVDLSPRAGQYVFIEFVAEGSVRGASADWNNPRFVTGP